MYLLDTVALSEFRKYRRDPGVVRWLATVAPEDLFVSTIAIGEVEIGIEQKRRTNAAFADELNRWLELTLHMFGERVIPIDTGAARRWGRLAVRIGNKSLDLAIAAVALERRLTVVTRNVSHFEPTGVPVFNPFSDGRNRDR